MSTMERLRPSESRLPVSPQLALRVAIMGGLALVMFGIIFFRLWYLQVLSGEQYVQQANANRVRPLPILPPRGEILDREGRAIATSHITNAVQIVPAQLPPAGHARRRLYARLGLLLGMKPSYIEELVVHGRKNVPYANVTIKTDAGREALTVLAERQHEFQGVTQQPVSIRAYPDRYLSSQVLGYVGQVSEPELRRSVFRGVKQGSVVGQTGIEYYYDRYLRGKAGDQKVQVNAAGLPVAANTPIAPVEPVAGYDLKLTIDQGLQREAEAGLAQSIGSGTGDAGAFVALDPRNGQVLAMGSSPGYDPNVFARPQTEAQYDQLAGRGGGLAPLFNRAAMGGYPTGSTFKPITAMAALQAGLITPSTTMGGGLCVHIGNLCLHNAGHVDLGDQSLISALKISEDTYFYEVGALANSGRSIQRMARQLGLGAPTGIDLPEEQTGIVPDAAWRARRDRLQRECEAHRHHNPCQIADGRPWTVGDNVNLAVGQGDLEASPLQMAVVYSTLANALMHGGEGTVVRPHLGMEIDDPQGRLIRALSVAPVRHVHLNYADLQAVMTGLREAAMEPGGTSADVWRGFGRTVYGKTGTAEHATETDQGWYLCYLPDPRRPIVMAVTVEQGGFGDVSAAPVARLMASKWFGKPLKFVHGSSTDR